MNTENILKSSFFARPAEAVAHDLIGKYLVKKQDPEELRGIITETEAYVGPEDKASHASRGRTERTEVMFGNPGNFYVYLIYGVHWMLNVVTDKIEYPSAVLIRGIEEYNGPGKLTKHFNIDKSINGKPASKEIGVWFEEGSAEAEKNNIERLARVGIDYAGEWADKPLRFRAAEPERLYKKK